MERKFKTAAALGIPETAHVALAMTLGLLETNSIQHVTDIDYCGLENGLHRFTGHFNMNVWCCGYKCQTVGCIGGTAEMVSGLPFMSLERLANLLLAKGSPGLFALFYPHNEDGAIRGDYKNVTPAQAARALANYLTTGAPNWKDVLHG